MQLRSPEQPEDTESPEAEVIESVMELQRLCADQITLKDSDFLKDLLERGLLKVGRNQADEVVATFYELPLDASKGDADPGQIFRIGGLATSGSFESKKAIVRMLNDLRDEIFIGKKRVLGNTKNEALGRFYLQAGLEEVAFEECKAKYPEAMRLYVEQSGKTEGEYAGKVFYCANL